MTTTKLTCQELVELVTNYLEGGLPPADRERFEAHLAGCQGCQNYLSQMRTTIRTLGCLTDENLPAALKDDLLTLFRNWKST